MVFGPDDLCEYRGEYGKTYTYKASILPSQILGKTLNIFETLSSYLY